MSIAQPSLWEELASAKPETYEFPISWADGCQELAQLERLAGLLKQHGHTARDDNGKLCGFKVISTRIEGGCVLTTSVLLPSINTIMSNLADDEDEVE